MSLDYFCNEILSDIENGFYDEPLVEKKCKDMVDGLRFALRSLDNKECFIRFMDKCQEHLSLTVVQEWKIRMVVEFLNSHFDEFTKFTREFVGNKGLL